MDELEKPSAQDHCTKLGNWTVYICISTPILTTLILAIWINFDQSESAPTLETTNNPIGTLIILKDVAYSLSSWNRWAFASKLFACILGGSIAALSVAVASKKLDNCSHYLAAASVAAMTFTYSILQPYEEYRQFRAAYAQLENAYLNYVATPTEAQLLLLIEGKKQARAILKENWQIHQPDGHHLD